MKQRIVLAAMLLTGCAAGLAWAQQPAGAPARAKPAAEDLEPAVNTSAQPPASAAATAPATSTAAGALAPAAARAPAANAAAAKPPAKAAAKSGKAMDRIQLDTTEITGNRELPKVLYIVPWKRSDLGDLVGKPVNSLLDEVLQPVDRDVFNRENRYYRALAPGQNAPAGAGAGSAPGSSPSGGAGASPGARDER
ncbi:MAG TPA: hypothetical protein VLW26_09850 [Steroidobacteraceae bacterium]|nr:hypothetical protein [Steroidobacteraceae bacterium]